MISIMYAWSLFRAFTFWLTFTSMAAFTASFRVLGLIMVSSFTYLDSKELINFQIIVLIRVLFCGSTHLYIFLKRVAYSDISSSSLCFRASHFQCQTSTWTLVLNLATNFSIKLCLWSVLSF